MDAKLVNPFVDAFTTVMPQIGFPEPKRAKLYVRDQNAIGLGVSVVVGFTKQIRGNVVYNMEEETAKYIASTMMMGMPVAEFDAMAQSAISEMSNMLTANAATNLTQSHGHGSGGGYFHAVPVHRQEFPGEDQRFPVPNGRNGSGWPHSGTGHRRGPEQLIKNQMPSCSQCFISPCRRAFLCASKFFQRKCKKNKFTC